MLSYLSVHKSAAAIYSLMEHNTVYYTLSSLTSLYAAFPPLNSIDIKQCFNLLWS